jgi:Tfp pilus assembly protein PilX
MLKRRRAQRGQALIGALAFLAFFGLVSIASFNFIDSSLRQHQRTEATAGQNTLAEGAAQYAVNTIANAKGTNCEGPASGTATWSTQGVTDTFSYTVNTCIPAYQNSHPGANCVLCVLGTASDALKFTNGNSMVNVRGEVDVNGGISLQGSWQKSQEQWSWNGSTLCSSTQATASSCFPSGTGTAEFVGVGDYADTTSGIYPAPSPLAPGAAVPYAPPPTAISTIADPLLGLSPPSFASPPYSTAAPVTMGSGTTVLSPGAYQGVSIGGGQTLKLQAGTYVFTGDLKTTGTGVLDGSAGVTIYLACFSPPPKGNPNPQPRLCNTGEQGAALNVQGGGTYNITAPASGTYQNIAVFQDRNSTAQVKIGGSGTSNVVSGGLYAASANVDIGGNGSQIFQANGRLVAQTVTIHVNASAGLDLIGTIPLTPVCDLYNASVTGMEGGNSRSGQAIFVADPGGVCGGTRIASFSYTS